MARKISSILASLKTGLVSAANDIGITINPDNWSKSDYKSLMLNTIATEQGIQEQLYDSFTLDVEAVIEVMAPQTGPWFKDKMINLFEYDATATPIVQLSDNNVPYYPNPNPNFNIIKYCSVNSGIFGSVLIKVAGQSAGLPSVLSAPKLSAAQSFLNIISADGINYNVVSRNADQVYIEAIIYYKGIYSAVIQSNVIAAINTYLASIPFDGSVEIGDLLISIRNVTGVNRVVFSNVQSRKDAEAYGAGTNMISAYTTVNDIYNTDAGYIISEQTIGHKLTDSLTFVAE